MDLSGGGWMGSIQQAIAKMKNEASAIREVCSLIDPQMKPAASTIIKKNGIPAMAY